MELIPNWRNAWKFTSVILLAAVGLYDALYLAMPDLRALMSPATFAGFNTVMSFAAIALRVVKQVFPVSPEVKQEMVETAHETPVKEDAPGP